MNKRSKAYRDGYSDGLAWDLDGYASHEDVQRTGANWDEATINAVGRTEFARHLGIAEDASDDDWSRAIAEYNAGAQAGATAPQDQRSGLCPGSSR